MTLRPRIIESTSYLNSTNDRAIGGTLHHCVENPTEILILLYQQTRIAKFYCQDPQYDLLANRTLTTNFHKQGLSWFKISQPRFLSHVPSCMFHRSAREKRFHAAINGTFDVFYEP